VADPQTEIGGLVVDESYRRRGVGRLLMEQAERWAREKGCGAICLRSNVVRKDAHAFYERIGYSNVKTSRVFHKIL
jgi:GNAT superfamily N-acetyltransferase